MMATEKRKHTKRTLNKDMFDELIADDVKKDIDIVRLFEDFGVKLSKKGNSFIGLCPFHDDKNPSLSVDQNKGLFNCFGCGESGDVITLVEKIKGLDFKGVLDYLKRWKNDISVNLSFESTEDLRLDIMEIEEPEEEVTPTVNETDQISLTDIAEHYHKELFNHQEAIEYLHKRGIKNQEIISNYKIGFSDGKSLLNKLSKKQIDSLIQVGALRKNGQEAFANCLIFPIFDDNNQVVHFYARNINDTAKVKHLYLSGSHKSVFNRKAVKIYSDKMILTECIIDAVSLIQLGINNVWSCYGAQVFTDEMLEALKEQRVKEIVIAFDNDDAGRLGAEKLKEKLIINNFAVRSILPPDKKDWNEELTNGITKEQILSFIDNAEVFNSDKKDKISYEIKGDTYYFTKDGLTYRVIGFKSNFTTELKLNFRCSYAGNKDKTVSRVLNVYAERTPELYIRAISEEFGVSADIIRDHFDAMIEIFEDERERLLDEKVKGFDKQVYVLTFSEEKEALDILTGSDILTDHLLPDTEKIGLVGEEMNKIICYHAVISRLWRRPVNIFTLSMYGLGKSFLHDTMHRFVPDEDLKDYSRITKNDLYYREEENAFVGKILSVDEVDGIADSLYSIRTLISKGYLSISYPSMDPVSGKMRNEENKVFGRPSVFVTGTNDDTVDEETLSRFAVCTTDASNDQRLKIKKRQLFEMTRSGMLERRMEDELVKKHKNILRMIKKVEVIFPEKWDLSSIENGDYSPRNNLCYLSFIASSAIRDQYNRKVYTGDDQYGKFRYVEIKKEDVILANRIMLELFGKSVRDLKPPQKVFLEKTQKYIENQIKGKNLEMTEVPFYEIDIRQAVNLSASQVSCYLNDLIRLEYIVLDGRGKHNKKRYKLAVGHIKDESEKYLAGLINPEKL